MIVQPSTPNSHEPLPVQIIASRNFIDWMQASQISLAFTTYQSSRLMLLGIDAQGKMSGIERIFDRAMGLYTTPSRLYLASRYQLWQLDNVLGAGELYNNYYDKVYVPRIAYTTGDLDVHDLALSTDSNQPVFISTLLNCLATTSDSYSCTPLWKPAFISSIINEDRCHLNGLAMVEGKPRYVTACSQSDTIDGWRDKRQKGGCVIDIQSNEVIANGLSMPHSPRFYQGKLWLLNAGTGDFGYVELNTGKFQPITFCPGFLRGLAFVENYALVGLSKPRREQTFSGLELDKRLIAKKAEPWCGIMVIDITTGTVVHWFRLEGEITELYDVQVLHGVKCPYALGFQSDEISRLITLAPTSGLVNSQSTRPKSYAARTENPQESINQIYQQTLINQKSVE